MKILVNITGKRGVGKTAIALAINKLIEDGKLPDGLTTCKVFDEGKTPKLYDYEETDVIILVGISKP